MSLNSTTTKVIYDGDGTTTEFPVTFKFLQNAHVRVILQAANGDETAWTEGTHYTLTGAGEEEGGTLSVLTIPVDHTPQNDEILVIKRSIPETQPDELPLGGTLPSSTLEEMVDRLTMMVQAHSEEIARSILLKETSQASGIEIPDPEANKFLRWDGAAENLENADVVDGGDIGVPVPVAQGGTNATTAAAARSNLGLEIGVDVLAPNGDGSGLTGIVTAVTGEVKMYIGTMAPAGWLLLNGGTIGSGASGADQADDGNEDLFKLLWESMSNSQAPVSGGRGANAQADWDADKTITLPDARGRSVIGTGTGPTLTARTHGDTGGAETHTLSESEIPSHTHTHNAAAAAASGAVADQVSSGAGSFITGSTGNDQPHNNMQPWLALNFIVKA